MFRNRKKESNSKMSSLISHYQSKAPVSEQYRSIRTNIQLAAGDQTLRSLVVTAPGPEEGTSTTSVNLAVTMAQQEKKVLLIDANLRRPSLHNTFSTNNTQGLSEILVNRIPLEEAVNKTEVEDLNVLPSGPVPPNPSELLSSHAMKELLQQVSQEYDMVVFDTPPVLPVTDARVITNQCDRVVLVVSSGKTKQGSAQRAKQQLEKSKEKLLGVIINQKPAESSPDYYYYG